MTQKLKTVVKQKKLMQKGLPKIGKPYLVIHERTLFSSAISNKGERQNPEYCRIN